MKGKLWELKKSAGKFMFFSDLDSYFRFLDSTLNNSVNLVVKDKITFGEQAVTQFEQDVHRAYYEEVTVTDMDHPIAVMQDDSLSLGYIYPSFEKEHSEQIREYAVKVVKEEIENETDIFISYYSLDDEIFELIIRNPTKRYLYTYTDESQNLTAEQRKKIVDNDLNFIVYNSYTKRMHFLKKSSDLIFGKYTEQSIKQETCFNYDVPEQLDESEIAKFSLFRDSINIKLSMTAGLDEEVFFKNVVRIFEILSPINKKFNISIEVLSRKKFSSSGLLNSIPPNVCLNIINMGSKYSVNEYIKNDAALDKLVDHILKNNLSPLEKYVAVYEIVSKIKKYKADDGNYIKSSNIKYLLDEGNDLIVCAGFSDLLKVLLDKVGIESKTVSVSIKREKEGEEVIDYHRRNLVRIDDSKYGVHGYYLADATWDNFDQYYWHHMLLTFDKMKESSSFERLCDYDLLLDFHDDKEFQRKIDYYLTEKLIKDQLSIFYVYDCLFSEILKYLFELDINKYHEFYSKYSSRIIDNHDYHSIENAMGEFLGEYACYIVSLSNNEIELNKIIEAMRTVKEQVYGYTEDELKEFTVMVRYTYFFQENTYFPYVYRYGFPEAYLGSKRDGTSRT